jgi:hypothetical protein
VSERAPLATTFVETHVFTKRIVKLGLERALRELQIELAANPKAGDVDPGTGGLRKVRVLDPGRGRGKRGGARVHYLWVPSRELIYLVFAYSKGEAATLTKDQRTALSRIVREIKRELMR